MKIEDLKEGEFYTFIGLSWPVLLKKAIQIKTSCCSNASLKLIQDCVACTFYFKQAYGNIDSFDILLDQPGLEEHQIEKTERPPI